MFYRSCLLLCALLLPLMPHCLGGYEINAVDAKKAIQELQSRKKIHRPSPPKLPRNFRWEGRYLVPDLGVNVPFTWHGKNGNIQMTAGSLRHPIYFTNLIYRRRLFTYTYKWPGLQPEFLPPLERCGPLFKFSLNDLNALFATAFFVGAEILEEKNSRGECERHPVHHFRLAIALPHFPPGFYPRLPVACADIYVDRDDPSRFLKILHFGIHNLYDPNLDEWIVIEKFEDCPGRIKLPAACRASL